MSAKGNMLDGATWASVLSHDPKILLVSPSTGFPVGAASAVGPLVRRRKVEIALSPASAWELPEVHEPLLRDARRYADAHPNHRLSFLCANDVQTRVFADRAWPAITLNRNMFVDETVFRPLADVQRVFDAVYNARLSKQKRHELAQLVPTLVLVYFNDSLELTPSEFHAQHERLRELMPGATFVNQLSPEGCHWLLPNAVNSILNQARVGLCLSAVEGQMTASIEYLMAGLPIVSTPSVGGRDYFFDPEYCVIVPDDPRAIRDAVAAMIQRNIPQDHVRAKTMERVDRERARFVAWVQGVIDRNGGSENFADRFTQMLRTDGVLPWTSMGQFASKVTGADRHSAIRRLWHWISSLR